jgi:hypothetical protein
VIHKFDNLGADDHARHSVVQSTMTLAFAAIAALAALVTDANASAREMSASSYGFADSLLTSDDLERSPPLPPFGVGALGCFVNCGPAFGTFVARRDELLTSDTDVSGRRIAAAAGHPTGLSGMIMIERLESDGFGSLMNWVVVSERTLDDNGSHSWSLLSGVPVDAPWLPSNLYRFEDASFSSDLAVQPPTTPEASTWGMMLIGFAGLSLAGYRSSRQSRRSPLSPKGVSPQ